MNKIDVDKSSYGELFNKKVPKAIISCESCGNSCFTGFHCPNCNFFNEVMQKESPNKKGTEDENY